MVNTISFWYRSIGYVAKIQGPEFPSRYHWCYPVVRRDVLYWRTVIIPTLWNVRTQHYFTFLEATYHSMLVIEASSYSFVSHESLREGRSSSVASLETWIMLLISYTCILFSGCISVRCTYNGCVHSLQEWTWTSLMFCISLPGRWSAGAAVLVTN